MAFRPAVSAFRLATNPGLRSRLRTGRVAASLAMLVVVASAIWLMPMTRRVAARLVVVPAEAHPLFAEAGGELAFALPAGAEVAAGDVVVRLSNPELELALAEAAGVVRQQRTRLAQLQALQATHPAASRQLPAAAAELAAAEAELAEQQKLFDSLAVRAPVAGRVVAAPARQDRPSRAGRLPGWTGSPLEGRNLGAWIEPRTPLCVVAPDDGAVAWAGVEQADAPAVAPGQEVRLLVDERPLSALEGQVIQVARRARLNHDRSEEASAAGESLLGDARYHVVQIAIEGDAQPLLPGSRGVARIVTDESNVGTLALDSLKRVLQRVF